MTKLILFAFLITAFAQWLVPGKMVWDRSNVLHNGKPFKFQTAPVDPENPFRGRYVALNFSENVYAVRRKPKLKSGQDIYVEITENKKGFAIIKNLYLNKPSSGIDYIQAKVDYINDWGKDSSAVIHIHYPFREYYMQEFKAPKAEKLYRDSALIPEKTYALVKVLDGDAAIERLYINDKPVEDLIK